MPSEATGAPAAVEGDSIAVVHPDAAAAKPTGLHSPPDSNIAAKLDGSDDSELSDLDDVIADADDLRLEQPPPAPAADSAPPATPDDDIGDVNPDHWSGTVPVFKPTMDQFKDFKKFMEKIDKYGMKSGIVKIIPPQEWKDALPSPEQLVKQVRVREPIKQDIMGSNGTYRQVNILHQRSYNLPQWRQLCDQSEHQPPAKRGERRANAKPAPKPRAAAAKPASSGAPTPRRSKRGRGGRKNKQAAEEETPEAEARPMTPESPKAEEEKGHDGEILSTVENEPGIKIEDDDTPDITPIPRRMGFTRQSAAKTQSTSARRKYAKREGSAMIDEAAFKDWDYRMDVSDYTPERCEELERIYWKTLTYAPPLYGADLPGTMFDESTDIWNLSKLPNLLDVLGTKVPGVNTAYLYLGMWKATFAWHLEDVDLYSINYLHFGAPKQWYSISQGDARRFEAAMKNIWPTDAKACDQFLRHKSFLISPTHLLQHYNIKVNKCVSYPGEFVVTYPYGYHSGYNLGYNCAEAVNFALDSWLPMGKIAKKCECAQAQDSVWIDVYEIERKLRGEETEYEETEDEEEEEDDNDIDDGSTMASGTVRVKVQSRKRKRPVEKEKKVKKIRLRVKPHVEPPCCLCPNDIPGAEIIPTDDGRKAHRLCALYLPETYIETEDDKEIVTNVTNIEKARLELRCMYCRSKRGACFQCSYKKCARAYHATCAAAAGVFVEEGDVPVFGEDGKEYKEQAFEFTCRFHRTKRDKKHTGDVLDTNTRVRDAARAVEKGQTVQMQFYRGDIFAGVVVENQHDEQMLLVDVVPNGDRVEVEWKWLLLPDPADLRLPKASANALPLPTTRKAKAALNAKKRPGLELPRSDDVFFEGFTWAEFHTCEAAECRNKEQVKVDLTKDDQVWHYLPKGSTETKPQYTEDPAKPRYNPKSHFLDSIPKPVIVRPPPPAAPPLRSYTAIKPPHVPHTAKKEEKPYIYKPRIPLDAPPGWKPPPGWGTGPLRKHTPEGQQLSFGSDPFFKPLAPYSGGRSAQPAGSYQPRPVPPNAPAYLSHGYTNQAPSRPWPQYPHSQQAGQASHGASARPAAQPSASAALGAKAGPKPPPKPFVKQSTTPIPPPVIPGAKPPQLSTFQKYAFFQMHHNRDSSRYRTPYGAWGGFTNGYEGNLRAHLSSTQPPKPPASIHKRNGSFGLGGGLTGLTRPKPHLNYNSPPSSSSSSSSPYSRTPTGHSAALSSASSYASFDGLFAAQKYQMHSPPQAHPNPFAGSPGTSLGGFEARQQQASGLHPAIRPQFGPVWQQNFTGPLPFAQAATDVNFSPPSPIATGVLAASPSIHPQSFMTSPTALATPFAMPVKEEPEEEEAMSHTTQSPAEQLKQQLRRISDPPLPSSYSFPHPAFEKDLAAHAPMSSQIPVPMSTPAQAPAPEPKQPKPNLHQPAPRPQPNLNVDGAADVEKYPKAPSSATRRASEVLTDAMLVQRIMSNLKKASKNVGASA